VFLVLLVDLSCARCPPDVWQPGYVLFNQPLPYERGSKGQGPSFTGPKKKSWSHFVGCSLCSSWMQVNFTPLWYSEKYTFLSQKKRKHYASSHVSSFLRQVHIPQIARQQGTNCTNSLILRGYYFELGNTPLHDAIYTMYLLFWCLNELHMGISYYPCRSSNSSSIMPSPIKPYLARNNNSSQVRRSLFEREGLCSK
jgi:hypothetical protein